VSSRRQVELYQQELLPGLERIASLTLLQYNAMLLGVYDLLESKQRELESRRASIEALRGYWVARAELERAVGGSLSRRSHSTAAESESSSVSPKRTPSHRH